MFTTKDNKKSLNMFLVYEIVSLFATLYMIYLWISLPNPLYGVVAIFFNIPFMIMVLIWHFSSISNRRMLFLNWMSFASLIFCFFAAGAFVILPGFWPYNLINIVFGIGYLFFNMAFAYYFFLRGHNKNVDSFDKII